MERSCESMNTNYAKEQENTPNTDNKHTEQDTTETAYITTRPEWLPKKFWNGKEVNIKALAQSYRELEKMISSRAQPKANTAQDKTTYIPCSTQEDTLQEELLQKSVDKQENNTPQDIKEYDIQIHSPYIQRNKRVEEHLYKQGFTNKQIQTIYTLAEEHFAPIIEKMHILNVKNMDTDLEHYFGGKDNWDNIKESLVNWASANLPQDTVQHLASSPEGIKNLYAMMQANKEHCLSENSGEKETLTEKKLKKMMNDPKYWRDRDSTYIEKVQQGFKTLFPTK